MTTVTSADLREHLADLLDRVAFGKERLVLTRRGKRIAAVVTVEDVDALERAPAPGDATAAADVAATIRALRGKYARVATSADAFAARKQSEKDLEG